MVTTVIFTTKIFIAINASVRNTATNKAKSIYYN